VRKTVIDPATVHSEMRTEQKWLDLEEVAKVEVTSEDPSFPLESALVSGKGPGWRAAQRGKQIIRIIFDKPTQLRRIRLEFSETEIARTQEFTFSGRRRQEGPSERSCASSGVSALKARPVKSKIIRSI
jgi:hypothetical protein